MKFAFVLAQEACLPVARMCRWLGVSRAGYYAWKARGQSQRAITDKGLRVRIHAAFAKSKRRYGSPRLVMELRATGTRIGRRRVIRLMRSEGLVARARRRFVRGEQALAEGSIAKNLLARDFSSDTPNRRWVGDTTEFMLPTGRVYLAALLDLFARRVVGWAVSAINDRALVLRALDNAVQSRRPSGPLMHHSDRGSPYTSRDYQGRLQSLGITPSMSRPGNCYDNAVMESFFSTVKAELGTSFGSVAEANRQLFDYIEVFYNHQRRHSTLGYLSPAEYERARGWPLSLAA